MIKFMRRLSKDKRGNTLMVMAACFPLVIGAAGLATDTIQWTLWKRQLQRAADSAAIAGVYEREAANGGTSTVESTIAHDLTLNLHTWMALKSGFPELTYPGNSGATSNLVNVRLAVQQRLPFSSIFLTNAPTIIATARAASVGSADGAACVHALESNASYTGITNSGNTTINAPDCVLYSNSPSTNAASAGGSSSVTALAIAAVGGISQSNNWHVGSYRPYSPALSDPFANVTPDPSDMHCTTSGATDSTNMAAMKAAGTNCFSSLSVGSNRTLNLPDNFGPIYINGGSVDLKGAFNCIGCTIVLTNISTATNATIGSISSNAQATNHLIAPTTGTYKGIAIYQDRRAGSATSKINGGSSSPITGAVYFPKQELWINGGGTVSSTCTMIVARRIVFTGNSGIKLKGLNDCTSEGLPSSTSPKIVRLVA